MSAPATTRPRPARIDGVLFDLDGVLIDSARAWHRVISLGTERFGCPAVSFSDFIGTFGQGPDADQRDFFPGRTVEQVSQFYAETFPQQLAEIDLMQGAVTLLNTLGARGLKRAVVTNTPRDLALRILLDQGLDKLLEATAAAGEAPEKPAPDLLQLALSRLDLSADQVIYIGDSKSDRGAAKAAGVFMIGLHHPGDATIEHLDQVMALIG